MAFATINKGASYFNTITYTGTGSSLANTGVGFQPDWVWIKGRSGATDHGLYDAVRGVQKDLVSNATSAETTQTTGLTAFGSDGFTVGALAKLNTSAATYVAWNWLGANTTVSNTSGTITSTVSANTTSGFSIVKWASSSYSDTIGHGLGVAPAMIIAKETSISRVWLVYHKSLGNSYYLNLNTTGAAGTPNAGRIQVSGSNTFICGTDGTNQIAYCFAEVKGYSKFGSYVGNGSTNGTFIYTGFKPAFVMAKASSVGGYAWAMSDNKRNPFNQANNTLYANASDAEYTSLDQFDLLSNGFKLRSIYGNTTSDTYIYMAFAENPFVLTDGTPVTAR